ncbi:hypothetical protein BKA66DRAFT_569298 [Pyrenochaeta sp. MPI-SDFR-AT-0127]|nr:hypothetical protein BKA66DRAFT_569298 [Pyrenochaeta sp. MPI-SDFR-AT-0127]
MEALAAVSLVGNIFQFVEFSHKLLRGTKELYHSQSESLQDTQDLETLTQGLQQICTALQDKSSSMNVGTATPQQRQQQAALRRLAKGCESSAKELLSVLQKLKAKDPKSKWSCFEAALATTWTQSRINAMQKRVEDYSSQLLLQLNFMGIDEPKCGSSSFTALFDDISNKSTALHTDMTEKITSLGAEILKSLQDIQLSLVTLMKTNHALLAPPTDTAHCLHVDNLTRSTTIVTGFAVALHLLKNLSFKGIDSRQYSIRDANANTLQWVFSNKFQSWTQSSEPIFWISGKPGSGKSTLMKWLAENKQTFDALRQWADTGTLITASYFFWCNGTDL